jgi:hypothetical protein
MLDCDSGFFFVIRWPAPAEMAPDLKLRTCRNRRCTSAELSGGSRGRVVRDDRPLGRFHVASTLTSLHDGSVKLDVRWLILADDDVNLLTSGDEYTLSVKDKSGRTVVSLREKAGEYQEYLPNAPCGPRCLSTGVERVMGGQSE